jgi:ubiquinone/menaquinone biosynthesis C-methylase UbiE
MHDLSNRVLRSELLDEGQIPDEEVRRTFLDLRRINRIFGGRRILLDALASEVARHSLTRFTVLDIATGSCDLPMAILDYARQRKLEAQVFALEYHHRYLALFRKELAAYRSLYPFCADALRAPVPNQGFDFVTCCHFLHHLPNDQTAKLLSNMCQWARYAVIVCDLERHLLPYLFFRFFNRFFTTSSVSRNDGLISLEQSFRKEELMRTAESAGLISYTVKRHWPFQLLLTAEITDGLGVTNGRQNRKLTAIE